MLCTYIITSRALIVQSPEHMSSSKEDSHHLDSGRELGSLTNSVVPRLRSPMEIDSKSSSCHHSRHSSYNTFVPQYTIDSEYLKSLLVNRFLPCELSQPASYSSSFVNQHQNYLNINYHPGDSGIHSEESETPSPPNLADDTDFFQECNKQLNKLYDFVKHHLSAVESDLALTMTPRHGDTGGGSDTPDEKDEEVGETTPLTGRLQGGPGNTALLSRLEQILNSLWESLATSFAHLDRLVEMHDDSTTSLRGREFLSEQSLTKIKLQQRISSNLETVNSKLLGLSNSNSVKVSLEGKDQVESCIVAEVRNYRPGCLTLFHVLLFLAAWFVLCFMYYYAEEHAAWAVAVRLLRSPFLVVFYFYLYGINIKAWADRYVDYVHIFGFPAKGTPTTKYAWKVAGIFCVIFTIILSGLLFLNYIQADIPVKSAATVMWLLLLVFLFNPTNSFLRRGRLAFILVVVRILIAPLHTVYFGDFWFADQLNSLVGILLDVQYYFCFMIMDPWSDPPNKSICTTSSNGIRPIISALPALWRLLQCLRYFYDERQVKHLINAVKYFTTFPVIIFATLFSVQVPKSFTFQTLEFHKVGWIITFWGIFSFIHALYTFIWDVYCDWGLLQLQHRTLLRPQRLYPWKSFYYIAIVIDLILRFLWTLKLTLAIVWHIDSDVIYTTLVAAEIFRRFMWNFFRVEYQQTLNTPT